MRHVAYGLWFVLVYAVPPVVLVILNPWWKYLDLAIYSFLLLGLISILRKLEPSRSKGVFNGSGSPRTPARFLSAKYRNCLYAVGAVVFGMLVTWQSLQGIIPGRTIHVWQAVERYSWLVLAGFVLGLIRLRAPLARRTFLICLYAQACFMLWWGIQLGRVDMYHIRVSDERHRFDLHSIARAAHMYYMEHHRFPPRYLTNEQGERTHGWRALLIPYINSLPYITPDHTKDVPYSFDEPWNGPNNLPLRNRDHPTYSLPNWKAHQHKGETEYFAVVGEGSVWSDPNLHTPYDVRDDPYKTLLFVEFPGVGTRWTEPYDLVFDEAKGLINEKTGETVKLRYPGEYICFVSADFVSRFVTVHGMRTGSSPF